MISLFLDALGLIENDYLKLTNWNELLVDTPNKSVTLVNFDKNSSEPLLNRSLQLERVKCTNESIVRLEMWPNFCVDKMKWKLNVLELELALNFFCELIPEQPVRFANRFLQKWPHCSTNRHKVNRSDRDPIMHLPKDANEAGLQVHSGESGSGARGIR